MSKKVDRVIAALDGKKTVTRWIGIVRMAPVEFPVDDDYDEEDPDTDPECLFSELTDEQLNKAYGRKIGPQDMVINTFAGESQEDLESYLKEQL